MHLALVRSLSVRRSALCMSLATAALLPSLKAYGAAGDTPMDMAVLASMEQRANEAAPRERAYLLTELADQLTVFAASQIRTGHLEQATETLARVENCAHKIEIELNAKSKDVKKAEMRLHQTERRLSDLVRLVSVDFKPRVQATLKRMTDTQRTFLLALFSPN